MASHNGYSRRSPDLERRPYSARDRDDDRPSVPYRDRRRSPDRRRDRRRSRSPPRIDRYQPDRVPRDDYRPARSHKDTKHERKRSPERSPVERSAKIDRYVPDVEPPMLVNPMIDPLKLDFQVGFTWFAEWWRTEQKLKQMRDRANGIRQPPKLDRELREEKETERATIQKAYDEYKDMLQKMQAQTFVRLHKAEDWFRERYDPAVRNVARPKLLEFRKTLYPVFDRSLSNGVFDNFDLEGIHKSESNGAEKEEGEATIISEVLQTSDLVTSVGGDILDPMASQPTLLLKTVAPTLTREQMEAFVKEHLGEGIGGLYHLSLSDPNIMKKCHRMGWVMLHSEYSVDQTEAMSEDLDNNRTIQERALAKINEKSIEDSERGKFTVHCGVHTPPEAPRKKALWDLFSSPDRIRRDLGLALELARKMEKELGDDYIGSLKIEQRVHELAEAGKLRPTGTPKQFKDPDAMDEYEEGEEGLVEDENEEADDEELMIQKKKLDLLIEYLRRVFNFCLFCVFEADSVHELQRKCPGGHLRRPRASLTTAAKAVARASASGEAFPFKKKNNGRIYDDEEADNADFIIDPPVDSKGSIPKMSGRAIQQLQRAFNWVSTYEGKLQQILEPEKVDIKKLGGIPVEEGIDDALRKLMSQEGVDKIRCKVIPGCKAFKSAEFWYKHVATKHPDCKDNIRKDLELLNAYVIDPARIAPSRSDAASNGHFPSTNNGIPAGTPRNFSLQTHIPGPIPTVYGPPGTTTNPILGLPASFTGVIRSQGRSNGHRNNGPYARNDGKVVRQPIPSGKPGMEGGTSAIGPREATQGRVVRSYEDLDAASGPPAKEAPLDY